MNTDCFCIILSGKRRCCKQNNKSFGLHFSSTCEKLETDAKRSYLHRSLQSSPYKAEYHVRMICYLLSAMHCQCLLQAKMLLQLLKKTNPGIFPVLDSRNVKCRACRSLTSIHSSCTRKPWLCHPSKMPFKSPARMILGYNGYN